MTGGHYSGVRVALAVVVGVQLAARVGEAPWLALGVAACVPLALGWRDRAAAGVALGLVALTAALEPARSAGWLPPAAALLVLHAGVPPAPFGSWDARDDLGRGWEMPHVLRVAVWVSLGAVYLVHGALRLPAGGPGAAVELAFAPLALSARLRPWVWAGGLALQLGGGIPWGLDGARGAVVLLHLFAFDPAWVPARGAVPVTVFYDGECGLCHRAVRFALAEDRDGRAFRFAPLASDAFRRAVPESERLRLPDSLVVRLPGGALRTRSQAVIEMGRRLGGAWRLLAAVAAAVPARLRDAAYDRIAASRRRLFARPPDACPVVDRELRARFDA